MKILLDSCTFLWLITDATALSTKAREVFRAPSNMVYLSSASLWELLVKHKLGHLDLPEPAARYLVAQREAHRIATLPIEEAAVATLERLPALHKDPFDRMLVCQAIAHGMVLLTPDAMIARYPVNVLW